MSLLTELRQQKAAIETLAFSHGARRIRVFGSVAREEESANSDIDFLVDFPGGYSIFEQRLALLEKLETLTGRTIDIIPEHELNKHIRRYVLDEAVEL